MNAFCLLPAVSSARFAAPATSILSLFAAPVLLLAQVSTSPSPVVPPTVLGTPTPGSPDAAAASLVPAISVNSGDISKHPDRYLGKRVIVKQEVEDVKNAHVFTLDEDAMLATSDLLVIVAAPRRTVKKDEALSVSGTVRRFARAEMGRDYSFLAKGGQGEVEIEEGRVILVADSIRATNAEELVVRPGVTNASPSPSPTAGAAMSPARTGVK